MSIQTKKMLSSVTCSLILVALCLALAVTPAFALTWTAQTSGTMSHLYSVVYDGSQFVAVGYFGTILTSPDGVTWTAQTSGTTNILYGAAYGGSQFVAVGDSGTILTSPNGVTWTAQTSGTANALRAVAYSGSQFVAVGDSGTILTSPNGVTWTAQTSGTTNPLYGVAYGGSQFVAVGYFGTILTSPDGVIWTAQTSGTTKWLLGVGYGGSQFVVVGVDGTIRTSPNGVTWTAQTSGTMEWLLGVGYGGSQFVVVGLDNLTGHSTILTSPNGVTWTADTPPIGTTDHLWSVGYGGSQFVAVGDSGLILTSSGGGGSPTLALTKSVNPSSAKPGDAITYTIAFSNTGAITATHVVITDTLSASVTNASYTSSGVALTLVPGSQYVWTAPDLLQNDGGVITITGVLTKPLAAGTLPNTVTLAVSGTVQTANASLTVQNVAPVANAGVDQTKNVSDTVTLDGSGTDDNGDTLTYGWTQTGGPDVTLSSTTAQAPTFTAPSTASVLTFTLTVTDAGSLTDTDEVVVTVSEGTPGYASAPAAGSTINVGQVKVGAPVTATLTISETGNATLNVTNLALTGPNAAEFSVLPTSFSIVDGGAAQTVTIVCTPASYGLRTATLTVNHNAAGSPATYTLNCTGKTLVYLPLVLRDTP